MLLNLSTDVFIHVPVYYTPESYRLFMNACVENFIEFFFILKSRKYLSPIGGSIFRYTIIT